MQVLGALAAGIRGCENGSAAVYRRGTSTAATLYSSFEGDVYSGSTVTLDSNGAAEVYVNELVDVVCRDSDGVEVRRYTEGGTANNIEYIGTSFTGVDYDTALSGASKPVTLQTILNAWYTSAGARDFNVSFSGASTSLTDTLSNIDGLYFNVLAYGATGDGTTDDSAAITAAITAANVSGGTVYFPAGTYRITQTLSPNGNVSFAGVNPDVSIIAMDGATTIISMATGTTRRHQFIRDMTIWHTSGTTGTVLVPASSGTTRLFAQNCVLGSSTNTGSVIENTTDNSVIALDRCEVQWVGTTGSAAKLTGGGSRFEAFRCNFYPPAGQTDYMIQAGGIVVHACSFVTAPNTASYSVFYTTNASLECSAVGNNFQEPTGPGTVTVFDLSGITMNGNTNFYEVGNVFGDPGGPATTPLVQPYSYTGKTVATRVHMGSRDMIQRTYEDDSASLTVDSDLYGNILVRRTAAGGQSIVLKDSNPGARLTLTFVNNSGGSLGANITFGNATPSGVAPKCEACDFTVITNGTATSVTLVQLNINGNLTWVAQQGLDNSAA